MLGSLVALAGVGVVSLSRAGISISGGVALVVAATIAQGVYHPLIKPLLNRYSSLEVATYSMIAGTVMTLPLLPWGWPSIAAADTTAWLSAIYLGLLPSALGFVLWGFAVRALPVAAATSLLYLVPGIAVLIAFLWLGERPTPGEGVGGLIIIAGVALLTNADRLAHRQAHRLTNSTQELTSAGDVEAPDSSILRASASGASRSVDRDNPSTGGPVSRPGPHGRDAGNAPGILLAAARSIIHGRRGSCVHPRVNG